MKPTVGWIARICRSAMLPGMIATGVRVGAQLLLLPFILSSLSKEQQSLWWLFVALGNVSQLADFGLGHAISRVYSFLWAGAEDFDAEGLRPPSGTSEPNRPRICELHRTVQGLYWKISWFATATLGLAGSAYLWNPIHKAVDPAWTAAAWIAYVLVIGLSLGTTHWTLACQGVNRVRELHAAGVWSGLAYVAAVAGCLVCGAGLMSIVAGTAARMCVNWFLMKRAFLQAVPGSDAKGRSAVNPAIVAKLWPNARKFGLMSIGAYLINNGNVLICYPFLGSATTASLGVTLQVGTFIVNVSQLWLGVKWPQIAILRAQGHVHEMSMVFARRLLLVMGTFAIMAVGVVLFGNSLLQLRGGATGLLETPALILYLVYLGHHVFYVQFGLLTFTENVVPFFWIGMLTGCGVFALSAILTPIYGLWGLLLAPCIVESCCSNWYTVRRGFSGQPLTVRQFIHAAFVGRPA